MGKLCHNTISVRFSVKFQMEKTSPRLRLKSSPLVYVLAQIVISPILSMQDYIPAIQEKLRHKGYIKYKHVPIQEIVLAPHVQMTTTDRWFFSDKKEQEAVIISPQFIVFETSSYDVFDTFVESLKEVFTVLQDIIKVSLAERVGLRYVNVIRPTEGQELKDYLQPGLLGISSEKLDATKSLYRFETNSLTLAGQLVLRLYQSDNGSYLPPDISLDNVKPTLKVEQGEIVTILDIDNFSLQQCDFEPDDLVKILWELHNYSDKAFKAAVTPDALKFWGAENI
jgi:uncharacterized protein (TIGR04255 family)